jgi:hypothetical protein
MGSYQPSFRLAEGVSVCNDADVNIEALHAIHHARDI